jgi:DNA-binding transcriptional MerR regulator
MSTLYRVRDFAVLAGVTVKALRHYERLGLIMPRRTRAGHRRYVQADLRRLEAITALKYLGFALDEIRLILSRPAFELPKAIAARRRAFDEAEARLTIARDAIDAAEPASGAPLDALVEAVQTKVAAAAMRKYYTEEGWQRRRRYYEEGPADEWRALYRALSDLVGHDPASDEVQAAADKWLALTWRAYSGDPAVQTDSETAWADRERWPARMKRRVEEFNLEAVRALIQQAAQSAPKRYFMPAAWDRYLTRVITSRDEDPQRVSDAWRARVDLFREIEAALDAGIADSQAEAFRARWNEQLESASGGDPEIGDALVKMWADREHWSATLRWQVEAIHWMPYDRLQKVAAFLERQRNSSHGREKVRIPTAGRAAI